ncbi:PREDICTED: protein C10 [Phaethon lepturus]|uniref:protein C10 n=1 Tax=Phaethon lepturus TaxID=97097 RepID=UPI00053084CE|nr:PREDICTED: protein C10 [Phaethon lepturus]
MEEARDNACNDMGKMLQFLLPVATQIQQDVIKAYGFSNDGEGGVLKFARLIKSYESQDPEIASMSGKLKAMFLPPMTLPPRYRRGGNLLRPWTSPAPPGRGALAGAFLPSYKPGRNVASEGVRFMDRRQEEQSIPSVSIYLSQLGLGLPPPL